MCASYQICGRSTLRCGSDARRAPLEPVPLCRPPTAYQLEPLPLRSGPPGPSPKVSAMNRAMVSEVDAAWLPRTLGSGSELAKSPAGTCAAPSGGTVDPPRASVPHLPVLGSHHSAAPRSPTAWRSHWRITGPCQPKLMVKHMSREMARESSGRHGSHSRRSTRNSSGMPSMASTAAFTPRQYASMKASASMRPLAPQPGLLR
mmetsp:Transcript_28339/g.90661  ORF Transcript_28339/g.90661 Transcript_28339/m.90661 type:complete len:203 (-) Transcript_28339:818-1426(-)